MTVFKKVVAVVLTGGMLLSSVACSGVKDSIENELNLSKDEKAVEKKDTANYEKYSKEFRAALQDFPSSLKKEQNVLDVTKVDVVQTKNKVDVVKVTITQNSQGFTNYKEKGNDLQLKTEIGNTASKLQDLYHNFVEKKGTRADSVAPDFVLEDGTSVFSVNTNGATGFSMDFKKIIEGK